MDKPQFPLANLQQYDTEQARRLQEEMAKRQLHLAHHLQQTALSLAAEKQLRQHLQHELETYAQELEAWKNQPGRSREQQDYVAGLAAELQDTFTKSVLMRLQLTNDHITSMVSRGVPLPEPPTIIEVVERPPRKSFWQRHQRFTFIFVWLVILMFVPPFIPETSRADLWLAWLLFFPFGLWYFSRQDRRNRDERAD